MQIEQLIKGSQFLTKTPGGGDAYFNENKDAAIIVYPKKTKIYTQRQEGTNGKLAWCFKQCTTVAATRTANNAMNSE